MSGQSLTPLILAVDTTHEYGSLALARGGQIIDEERLHGPTGFAHVLYGHLGRLLERHGVRPEDLELVASASGPGSFTGVRVGLAAVKGLAEAIGRPAVAISNLRAVASFGGAMVRAAVMDARRGEVYGGVYDADGNVVCPEAVTPLEKWLEELPRDCEEIVSTEFGRIGDIPMRFRRITAPDALAGAIARLAFAAFRRGEACDPAALDANYVRRSDAELFWKE